MMRIRPLVPLILIATLGLFPAWAHQQGDGEAPVPEAPPAATGQGGEQDAVLAVVQQFFDTMTAKDVAGARATLIIDGQFVSVRDGDNGPSVRATPLATYIEGLSSGTRLQEERMWDPIVMLHGRLATVWTPYDFHNDGELSHCGIDAFSLVKVEDGWRIAGVTYTVEPTGCEALGQPPRGAAR